MIGDDDRNVGSVDVIDADQKSELGPSQRVDLMTLSHLSVEQRTKLLALLDKCSECFSEKNPDFSQLTSISLITLLCVSLLG